MTKVVFAVRCSRCGFMIEAVGTADATEDDARAALEREGWAFEGKEALCAQHSPTQAAKPHPSVIGPFRITHLAAGKERPN